MRFAFSIKMDYSSKLTCKFAIQLATSQPPTCMQELFKVYLDSYKGNNDYFGW